MLKFVGVFLVVLLFVSNSLEAESVDWTDADSDGDGVPDIGWVQLGENIDGEAAGDESGSFVSISSDGGVVAIGARGNDEKGPGADAGHVRVYS